MEGALKKIPPAVKGMRELADTLKPAPEESPTMHQPERSVPQIKILYGSTNGVTPVKLFRRQVHGKRKWQEDGG